MLVPPVLFGPRKALLLFKTYQSLPALFVTMIIWVAMSSPTWMISTIFSMG